MTHKFSRFFAIFLLAVSAIAMLTATTDANARRFGGGMSFGRQSTNIFKQRKAVKPPAASRTAPGASSSKAQSQARGAGQPARSGMSRWLGPIAGIAAGLGIASLLSALGLSGAFLEFMSSLILIALAIWAVRALLRRLRATAPRPATQAGHPMARQSTSSAPSHEQHAHAPSMPSPATPVASAAPADPTWFIPEDFDTTGFLDNAKAQFIRIQELWDRGDMQALGDYLTDDLLIELQPQIEAQTGETSTEVVILNAQLMGFEKVAGGHLASVRYAGMLRESPNPEATRFEEVWNLYKSEGAGWLVAGIQQVSS